MQEPIFVDGLMFQAPREGAPDFVKGSILVKVETFVEWIKQQDEHKSEKGWLNIDMKKSKKGGLYFQLNTWKPTPKSEGDDIAKVNAYRKEQNEKARQAVGVQDPAVDLSGEDESIDPNDIPFN